MYIRQVNEYVWAHAYDWHIINDRSNIIARAPKRYAIHMAQDIREKAKYLVEFPRPGKIIPETD